MLHELLIIFRNLIFLDHILRYQTVKLHQPLHYISYF